MVPEERVPSNGDVAGRRNGAELREDERLADGRRSQLVRLNPSLGKGGICSSEQQHEAVLF